MLEGKDILFCSLTEFKCSFGLREEVLIQSPCLSNLISISCQNQAWKPVQTDGRRLSFYSFILLIFSALSFDLPTNSSLYHSPPYIQFCVTALRSQSDSKSLPTALVHCPNHLVRLKCFFKELCFLSSAPAAAAGELSWENKHLHPPLVCIDSFLTSQKTAKFFQMLCSPAHHQEIYRL